MVLVLMMSLEFYSKLMINLSYFNRTYRGPVRCYCSNRINSLYPSPFPASNVTIPCPGNLNQTCGGYDYLPSNIYAGKIQNIFLA